MQIAHNPETGEYLGLQDGQWQKLSIAANDAGEKMYLGPTGWIPLQAGGALTPSVPQVKDNSPMRSFGVGTRGVLEGLGSIPHALISQPLNAINSLLGGSPDYWQNPGKTASDLMDLPKADTNKTYSVFGLPISETTLGAGIEGAAGALPTMGAGFAMQAAGKAPLVAKGLTDMPKLQAISGFTGGTAIGAAQNAGADPIVQIMAALAGGAAPGMLGASTATFGRGFRSTAGAMDRLTPSGQKRLAGTALEKMASDPVRARQIAEQGGGVLVEGSMPTTAQLTADPGLALVEKAMQSTPLGGGIRGRYDAQKNAQREFLNNLMAPIQERQANAIADVPHQLRASAPFGGTLDERTAGGMLREAFDTEYGTMKKSVHDAYQSIDPHGTSAIDAKPLISSWMNDLDADDLDDLPPLARKELGRIMEAVESGGPITYSRLQKARTRLSSAEESVINNDRNAARLAGIMKRHLDDFIENVALPPDQAEAYQRAKALRRVQGERFEQGVNQKLAKRGDMLGGQSVADSSLPDMFFSPRGIGSENMEAFQRSIGGQASARNAVADRVISSALRDSTGVNGELDPRKLAQWIENYRPALSAMENESSLLHDALLAQQGNFSARDALKTVARVDPAGNWEFIKRDRQFPTLPRNAGLNADEAARFGAAQADLKRVLDTHNRAAVNGSPTAQLGQATSEIGGIRLGVGGGGGMLRNMMNGILSPVTKHADDNITRMLVDSVLDPEYAAKLLANTNTMRGDGVMDMARRWAGRPGQEPLLDMLNRWGIATTVGAARGTANVER